MRACAAVLGGTVQETAQIVLPRFARNSRLYEATAKNLLRVMVELVGGVESETAHLEFEPSPGKLAVRKGAGNVVELGSIAAFGATRRGFRARRTWRRSSTGSARQPSESGETP